MLKEQRKPLHNFPVLVYRLWRLRKEIKIQLLIKRIPFEKGVLFHLFVHCVLLLSRPFYEITCYWGHWVHDGCAVLEILLRASDFQELTDSSQDFQRVLDYLHTWHINEAAWKSFPGLITTLGHFKEVLCFYLKHSWGVNLPTQISKQCTSLMQLIKK